jgi:hypothetical protein
MNKDNNLGPLLIILVTLLIAAGGYQAKIGGWPFNLRLFGGSIITPIEVSPPGELVDGFPAELVNLAEDFSIKESGIYSLSDESGEARVFRVVYVTEAGIPTLFAAYVDYLTGLGYTITESGARGASSALIAKNKKQEVRVDISAVASRKNEVRIDIVRPVIQ